jgi:hypothetical protein
MSIFFQDIVQITFRSINLFAFKAVSKEKRETLYAAFFIEKTRKNDLKRAFFTKITLKTACFSICRGK